MRASHATCLAIAAFAFAAVPALVRADDLPSVSLQLNEFDAFQNKTLEQKVQELADREEIRELIARYAHRVALGQSFADLFTEDGVYINRHFNPVRELRGRKAIAAQYDNPAGGFSTTDKMSNALTMLHDILIEITGNTATAMCTNDLRIVDKGESILAVAVYSDRLRRVNGRWKFELRDIGYFHWAPLNKGWAAAK